MAAPGSCVRSWHATRSCCGSFCTRTGDFLPPPPPSVYIASQIVRPPRKRGSLLQRPARRRSCDRFCGAKAPRRNAAPHSPRPRPGDRAQGGAVHCSRLKMFMDQHACRKVCFGTGGRGLMRSLGVTNRWHWYMIRAKLKPMEFTKLSHKHIREKSARSYHLRCM